LKGIVLLWKTLHTDQDIRLYTLIHIYLTLPVNINFFHIMGCGSCGTKSADGKPSGCQSNGGCSTGGCNRLNVYNWLSDIPFSDYGKQYHIVEVSFNKGSRKDYYKNATEQYLEKGDWIVVEGVGGVDIGQVSLTGELVKLQQKKYNTPESDEMKRIIRTANERDLDMYEAAKIKERDTMVRARAIAKELNLEMKIAEVEFQADSKKITFFYTADNRVDFRELIKVFASDFKSKIEMRQIGARQESGKVGGIGSCGRELCCSSWLSDFKTVNTTAARYQNLSINQTKLSGQCGRLKCCLNYELDTYMDALHEFPENADQLEFAAGRAYLQKKDIFRNLMWYAFSGSNKQYPLTIERVRETMAMNAEGNKPEDIGAVEVVVTRQKDATKADMGFVNDVGQLTLSSLSKSNKKKNNNKPQQNKSSDTKTSSAQNSRHNNKERVKEEGGPTNNKPKPTRPQNAAKPKGQEQRNAQEGRPNPNTQQNAATQKLKGEQPNASGKPSRTAAPKKTVPQQNTNIAQQPAKGQSDKEAGASANPKPQHKKHNNNRNNRPKPNANTGQGSIASNKPNPDQPKAQ
jgi:cell fate regulator YaaT (PSP1 superfamily)